MNAGRIAAIDATEAMNEEDAEFSSNTDRLRDCCDNITRNDAAALIKICLERGYFHANVTPDRSEDITFRSHYDREAAGTPKYSKEDALLVETMSQNSYIMLDTLLQQFTEQLNAVGRWSVQEAAEVTNVDAATLCRRIVPRAVAVAATAESSSSSSPFTVLHASNGDAKVILTAKYLNDKTDELWATLLLLPHQHQSPERGIMSVAEAAESIYRLPIDMTLAIIEKRISTDGGSSNDVVQLLLKDNGSKVLVTASYLKLLEERIADAFRACTDEPAQVKAIAKQNGWDVSWVMRMVRDDHFLAMPGKFHGETYVPTNFTESKRRSVAESFATNGFVTSHMCHTMFGISPSQMIEYATATAGGDTDKAAGGGLVVLENSVVHKDVIVAPLVESAKDAAESVSWLDLQLLLPVELLDHQTEDARALVEEYVLTETPGVSCIRSDGALFLSQPMIDRFTKNNIPGLIKTYASSKTKELLSAVEAHAKESGGGHAAFDDDDDDDDAHMTGKEKRKTRKAASKSKHTDFDAEIQATEYATVPLDDIVKALVGVHPDLSDLDSSASCVLAEICNLAFCTDSFESLCADAVQAELARIRSEKKTSISKSVSRTVDAVGDFRSTEAAFEDPGCYATACYMIQAKAKFLTYAVDCSEPLEGEMKAALERDFLTGCCADFTSRVTQYALLKNNVDEGILSFQSTESDTVRFYAPVDLAVRSYGKVYLACAPEKAGKRRDPLPLLREELPGSVGVALARQWILCGGDCYQGGVKPASENGGEAYTRPGDVEAFLTLVRENSFSICGLPFSNLDKKAEKKFLCARRLRLMDLLEEATDAGAVLDLRIMLLYQLVKNMVVSGPLLRCPILRMLTKERKVSESVAAELLDVAERLAKGQEIDAALLKRLKDCAPMKHKI